MIKKMLMMYVNKSLQYCTFYVQIEPWLKNKDLPKIRTFTTVDEKFLNEAKALLNEYLKVRYWLLNYLCLNR
jgi:hypothetical protein